MQSSKSKFLFLWLLLLPLQGCWDEVILYEKPNWNSVNQGAKLLINPATSVWYAKADEGSDSFPKGLKLNPNRILVPAITVFTYRDEKNIEQPGSPSEPGYASDWSHRDLRFYESTPMRKFEIIDSVSYWILEHFLFWGFRKGISTAYPVCYLKLRDENGIESLYHAGVDASQAEREIRIQFSNGQILDLDMAAIVFRFCGAPGLPKDRPVEQPKATEDDMKRVNQILEARDRQAELILNQSISNLIGFKTRNVNLLTKKQKEWGQGGTSQRAEHGQIHEIKQTENGSYLIYADISAGIVCERLILEGNEIFQERGWKVTLSEPANLDINKAEEIKSFCASQSDYIPRIRFDYSPIK